LSTWPAEAASASGTRFGRGYDGDVAVPLTYRAVSNSDRDPRLFFGISKSFKFN
jgi:hypothetical protein